MQGVACRNIFLPCGINIYMTGSNKMVHQYRWLRKNIYLIFVFVGGSTFNKHFFGILKTKSTTENKGLIKTISLPHLEVQLKINT